VAWLFSIALKEPVFQPMSTIYYDRFGIIGMTNSNFIIAVAILQQFLGMVMRRFKVQFNLKGMIVKQFVNVS